MNIHARFERCYLGDASVQELTLEPAAQRCTLRLSGAAVLRDPDKPFDYEQVYEPACLTFLEVRSVRFPEAYCLNHLIVDYSVGPCDAEGYSVFSLSLTGGWSNETFMRTIEILAKDFSLTPMEHQIGPQSVPAPSPS